MSLSYLEPELIKKGAGLSGRIGTLRGNLAQLRGQLEEAVHEVAATPQVSSIFLRVVTTMAIGFVLVRLVKFYAT